MRARAVLLVFSLLAMIAWPWLLPEAARALAGGVMLSVVSALAFAVTVIVLIARTISIP